MAALSEGAALGEPEERLSRGPLPYLPPMRNLMGLRDSGVWEATAHLDESCPFQRVTRKRGEELIIKGPSSLTLALGYIT